jgi:hypothetical protein
MLLVQEASIAQGIHQESYLQDSPKIVRKALCYLEK